MLVLPPGTVAFARKLVLSGSQEAIDHAALASSDSGWETVWVSPAGNQLHVHSRLVHIGQVFSVGRNGTAGDCVANGIAGELLLLQFGTHYRAATPHDPGKHTRKANHT